MQIAVRIVTEDVCNVECDVLVLKYAQQYYGADAAVKDALQQSVPKAAFQPLPGAFSLINARGHIKASQVLFIGTEGQSRLNYGGIRDFASGAMNVLGREVPHATRVAMTLHGVSFGLDERECFLAQLRGVQDSLNRRASGAALRLLLIAEHQPSRARRLKQFLKDFDLQELKRTDRPRTDAGQTPPVKGHVFVAMPFSDGELEDVYAYGIQAPVNGAGLICERTDMVPYIGDVLNRVKERIDTAVLVIADVSGANPNVYLEVGYAWGRDRPTLIIARRGEQLKFDLQGQKCLFYRDIADLAKRLTAELAEIASAKRYHDDS